MPETKSALIVASWDYKDADLCQLAAPANDAEDLARVLRDATMGGFDVQTLLNATSREMSEQIESFFLNRKRDDLLLLYFSGHGVKDDDGQLYFTASDTRLIDHSRPMRSTAISADFVREVMRCSKSRRQVLILDCCYSGAFAGAMMAKGDKGVGIRQQFDQGRGMVIMTASDALQYSFEGDKVEGEAVRSVFTSSMVRGIETGAADLDCDGNISLDELYDYIYAEVAERNAEQRPRKWTLDVEGKIIVAQSPSQRAAELPSDLLAAIASPLPRIREGAARELGDLLAGSHKGLVLAARLALTKLLNDDSRLVSRQAEALLGAAILPVPAVAPEKPSDKSQEKPSAPPPEKLAPPANTAPKFKQPSGANASMDKYIEDQRTAEAQQAASAVAAAEILAEIANHAAQKRAAPPSPFPQSAVQPSKAAEPEQPTSIPSPVKGQPATKPGKPASAADSMSVSKRRWSIPFPVPYLLLAGLIVLVIVWWRSHPNAHPSPATSNSSQQQAASDTTARNASTTLTPATPVVLLRPPFDSFSDGLPDLDTRVRLTQVSATRRQITDEEAAWFSRNGLRLPILELPNAATNTTGDLPPAVPTKYGDNVLIIAIQQGHHLLCIYGPDFGTGRYLVSYDLAAGKTYFSFDLNNFLLPPEYQPSDRDVVAEGVTWAWVEDGVLYVSNANSTFAKTSSGSNAYLSAIDIKAGKLLWRSAPLTDNARNFVIYKDAIIAGYGFTDESHFLYVVNKANGKVAQTIPLRKSPEYILAKDDKIYVRTYDTDNVFQAIDASAIAPGKPGAKH